MTCVVLSVVKTALVGSTLSGVSGHVGSGFVGSEFGVRGRDFRRSGSGMRARFSIGVPVGFFCGEG